MNKKFEITKERKEALIKNGFTEELIEEMYCTDCGNFGFECTCLMSEEGLQNERLIAAQNLF